MPTKLKQLKVTSVDFVNSGANPGAKISIFKSASEQTEFKKICAMIAKKSGVDEDTVSKVLTTVVTQDAINTNQSILKISEKHIEQNTPENNSSKIDKADDKDKGILFLIRRKIRQTRKLMKNSATLQIKKRRRKKWANN